MAKTSNRKKRSAFITFMLLASVAAVMFIACATTQKASIIKDKFVVYIPEGGTYEMLLDSLANHEESIKNLNRFNRLATMKRLDESLKPGRYQLRKGMSANDMVAMFRSGTQAPLRLTFNNIRTMEQFAGRISSQIKADSATLLKYFTSDSVANAYGFRKNDFIGMFIPNTYEVYWNISPEAFLNRMKSEYDSFWQNSDRAGKLKELNMSQKQISTLASIVYEETKMSDEMPRVAGVYINRLRTGMPLQADPTVKFAVGDAGLKRLRHKHLTIDSPYNTYKYKGLPPGPICMPSIKAIDAVLNYEKHEYIFFCASPDFSGYHSFARTLTEHNKNARGYSRALDNAGIIR